VAEDASQSSFINDHQGEEEEGPAGHEDMLAIYNNARLTQGEPTLDGVLQRWRRPAGARRTPGGHDGGGWDTDEYNTDGEAVHTEDEVGC
jgi:hypothetical protein